MTDNVSDLDKAREEKNIPFLSYHFSVGVKTYTFTTSGVLYPDHTFPGVAIVMVTSPNAIQSPGVHPNGACR